MMSYNGRDDEYCECECSSCLFGVRPQASRAVTLACATAAWVAFMVIIALTMAGCAHERRILAFSSYQDGGAFSAFAVGDTYVRVLDEVTRGHPELRNKALEILDGVDVRWEEEGASQILDLPYPGATGHVVVSINGRTDPKQTDLPALLTVIVSSGIGLIVDTNELARIVAAVRTQP